MIIELLLKINETKTLLCAWDIPTPTWKEKSPQIISFIENILESQNVSYSEKLLANNKVYEILGKPYYFYDTQSAITDYLSTILKNSSIVD